MKTKQILIPAIIAGTLMISADAAFAASVITFDPSAVNAPAGPFGAYGPFSFDEMTWRSFGNTAMVSITDTSLNGSLDDGGLLLDAFSESVTVFQTQFFLNGINIPLATSGLNIGYEIFATASLSGVTGLIGTDVVAAFNPLTSGADMWIDSDLTAGLQAATATKIGVLTQATGNCVFTPVGIGFGEGSCGMDFLFDDAGVTDDGVFTYQGVDLGALSAPTIIDLNIDVDSISPQVSLAYPGGPGSTQDVVVIHDGSSTFVVPEPSSLALLGLGMLGLGNINRKKVTT